MTIPLSFFGLLGLLFTAHYCSFALLGLVITFAAGKWLYELIF